VIEAGPLYLLPSLWNCQRCAGVLLAVVASGHHFGALKMDPKIPQELPNSDHHFVLFHGFIKRIQTIIILF